MEKIIFLYYKHFNYKYLIFILFFFLYKYLDKIHNIFSPNTNIKKNTPKISVFLPIYNGEKTIKKSIRSIQDQTLTDLEIIAVNDCSNDSTLNILNELSKTDNRIKIVNNDKNYGLLYSRAMGILNSTGEYLLNLDADDEIKSTDSLEYLYNKVQNSKVDIVGFDIFDVKKNKTIKCRIIMK